MTFSSTLRFSASLLSPSTFVFVSAGFHPMISDTQARAWLCLRALLSQVGLPETEQQGLREPSHQRSTGLCSGSEDLTPDSGLEEILAVVLSVSQIGVGVPMREMETRQLPRQVGRQIANACQVEDEFRNADRSPISL